MAAIVILSGVLAAKDLCISWQVAQVLRFAQDDNPREAIATVLSATTFPSRSHLSLLLLVLLPYPALSQRLLRRRHNLFSC